MTSKLLNTYKTDYRPGALVIVGSFQSIGILRSLANHKVPTCLIDWDLCVGRFSKCTNQFFTCPPVTEEKKFLEFLLDLAVKQKMRGWLIYPNDDRTVEFLARHKRELEDFFRIPVPDWEVVQVAIDKRLTHRLAEQIGIPIPKTVYPKNVYDLRNLNIKFPVIIKPAIRDNFYDKARKKAVRANDMNQLIQEYRKVANLIDRSEIMIQELIPGAADNLYSFGSLFKDGQVLGKVVARRVRQHPLEFGRVTTHAETVNIPELEDKATRFLNAMDYQGISEVEFMWDPRDAKYKLIEINARFWAWHSIAITAGVEFPYLLYRNMLGDNIRVSDFKKGVKWFRLLVDIPICIKLLAKRKMYLDHYFKSWNGKKTFAVLNLKDPMPFLAEILMIPYIIKIRGI